MTAITRSVSRFHVNINIVEIYENLVIVVPIIGLGMISYLSACMVVL